MQGIVTLLQSKKIINKKCEELSPKILKIRNKVRLYHTLDLSNRYGAIVVVSQKSRILQSNIEVFESIIYKMSIHFDHNFALKTIVVDAPLCSKAETKLKQNGWKVLFASV